MIVAMTRLEAAVALIRATDLLMVLEHCEVLTGRAYVQNADRTRVIHLRRLYLREVATPWRYES